MKKKKRVKKGKKKSKKIKKEISKKVRKKTVKRGKKKRRTIKKVVKKLVKKLKKKKKQTKDSNIVAKVIFVKRFGKNHFVCMEKRKNKEDNYAGFWSFPQGHKKRGEKIAKTFKREMSEELKIKPIAYRKLGIFKDRDPTSKKLYTHNVFICFEWIGSIKRTYEQDMIAWFPLKEAFSLKIPEIDKRILEKLLKY